MSALAAISAHLVDVRNIAAHKCVRLEIHVPVEQAAQVMAVFGWPTMADPVPVALARLDIAGKRAATVETDNPKVAANKWDTLSAAKQAGILCNKEAFWRFLEEQHGYAPTTAEEAAEAVRDACSVHSRAMLDTDRRAGGIWSGLEREYQAWLNVVPA